MKTVTRCSMFLSVCTLAVGFGAGLTGCDNSDVVDVTPRKKDPSIQPVDPNGGFTMEAQGSGG